MLQGHFTNISHMDMVQCKVLSVDGSRYQQLTPKLAVSGSRKENINYLSKNYSTWTLVGSLFSCILPVIK